MGDTMSENVIVKSGIKPCIGDMQLSADVHAALETYVKGVLARAVARARENGRKTVMPHDL